MTALPKKSCQSPRPSSLLTAATLCQLREWLHKCQKTHGNRCRIPDSPAWVPKRLVNVHPGPDGSVSVVETAGFSNDKNPKYMTLSHCWGTKDPMLMLKHDHERAFTNPNEGIEWSDLPKNFRDAIEIARALDVRYIWIDSLCIVQDNGEFATEGQLMHLVYRNSFCNLAAVDSDGCQGGFFPEGLTEPLDLSGAITSSKSPIFGGRSWHVLPSDLWEYRLLNKILYTRGWVFQGKSQSSMKSDVSKKLTKTRTNVVSSTLAFLRPPDICKSLSISIPFIPRSLARHKTPHATGLTDMRQQVGLRNFQRMRDASRRSPRSARHSRCNRTTLEGTITDHADKYYNCAPGQAHVLWSSR